MSHSDVSPFRDVQGNPTERPLRNRYGQRPGQASFTRLRYGKSLGTQGVDQGRGYSARRAGR